MPSARSTKPTAIYLIFAFIVCGVLLIVGFTISEQVVLLCVTLFAVAPLGAFLLGQWLNRPMPPGKPPPANVMPFRRRRSDD